MCTVTFIARRNGYALGMNRDEKLARVKALRPARYRLEGRTALYPSEPGGGTWIGVNDVGAAFALVNWYSASARVAEKAISRGTIVTSTLIAESPDRASEILTTVSLERVNTFRLLGIFPASQELVEWRWDVKRLDLLSHRWRTNIWVSSGFDEPGAEETRCRTFQNALQHRSVGNREWLRRLHRSHSPDVGPYSLCMHRDDAATVSYTEILVSRGISRMRYQPGSPCAPTTEFIDSLKTKF